MQRLLLHEQRLLLLCLRVGLGEADPRKSHLDPTGEALQLQVAPGEALLEDQLYGDVLPWLFLRRLQRALLPGDLLCAVQPLWPLRSKGAILASCCV